MVLHGRQFAAAMPECRIPGRVSQRTGAAILSCPGSVRIRATVEPGPL
ncbi:hypothetical protein NSERUTF1_5061 [Nocardia seriolae]|nr:hypothetical protein NSERUTF1_5061 [Nocardia seriolae]